jgi:hypothetical protein
MLLFYLLFFSSFFDIDIDIDGLDYYLYFVEKLTGDLIFYILIIVVCRMSVIINRIFIGSFSLGINLRSSCLMDGIFSFSLFVFVLVLILSCWIIRGKEIF